MVYCKAKFGKGILGRGMGFGNRLFPWARCRVYAHLHGAQVISPVWMRPAIAQILRGGIDYKSYLRQLVLLGLFKKRKGDYGVIEGMVRTLGAQRIREPENLDIMDTVYSGKDKNLIFIFEGQTDTFKALNGWNAFLHKELRAITKPRYLNMVDSIDRVPIGICVRCGNDFREPDEDCAVLSYGDKTPIRWFVRSLQAIREAAGFPVKAYVVSDGTCSQLRELLEMENVIFVRPGSAVSDLLVLAKAEVLIGSGTSTFAAWGCFLGEMPCISHPGQPFTDWDIVPLNGQFIGVFYPGAPSKEFINQAVALLTK